jgi:NAD(P)H dehydrogenase (quinone)
VAAVLAEVLGHPVVFTERTREDDKLEMMNVGVPEPIAAMNAHAVSLIAEGDAARLSEDVPAILGRPAGPELRNLRHRPRRRVRSHNCCGGVTMPVYAVTGASGALGRLAIGELLARDVSASGIVAIVRSPAKVADLAERGVVVRAADYSRPRTLGTALGGVDRLLLISSSEAGQRVVQHTNVIEAAKTAGTSRIVYTSILNADNTTNPLAGEHQDTERVLQETGVAFTLLRNGWYTENYTDQLGQYLQHGEILGAAGRGRISAATRADYAAAAAAALLQDQDGNRTYQLGGPAFDLAELAQTISEDTGTPVTYRDLPVDDYASQLQETGLDDTTAHFVAALDASIAHGDLETDSQDLARLLGRPATPLADVVRATRS